MKNPITFMGLPWSLIKTSSVMSQYIRNPEDPQKGRVDPSGLSLNLTPSRICLLATLTPCNHSFYESGSWLVTKGNLSLVMTSLLSPTSSWTMSVELIAQQHASHSEGQQAGGPCWQFAEALSGTKDEIIHHYSPVL